MNFVLSTGIVLAVGFLAGYLLNKIKLPGLVGMIIVGLVFGPYVLKLIDPSLLNISSQLRQIALIIILTRSGLNLNLKELKKVGRPAILMCFVPATCEIVAVTIMSIFVLKLTIFESILLGSVLAAVSPAVVSPRMIKLIDEGYGKEHFVPQIVLAGSSADDIYTIIIFYTFLGIVEGGEFDASFIGTSALSVVLGILVGIGVGYLISLLIKKTNWKTAIYILVIFATSLLLVGTETLLKEYSNFNFSSLLSVLVIGMIVLFTNKDKAKDISNGYNNIWLFFEIILFVLVGATVDLSYAVNNFLPALLVLFVGLIARSCGVLLCLIKTKLNGRERLFCVISYLPKATVQASIGGIALSLGLPCGSIILTVSVLSILITAPLGAILIDNLGRKLLTKTENIE